MEMQAKWRLNGTRWKRKLEPKRLLLTRIMRLNFCGYESAMGDPEPCSTRSWLVPGGGLEAN